MITYEIVIFDSSFESLHIPVNSFVQALRIFNAISLSDDLIFRKEFFSHDWSKRVRYRLAVEGN